MASIKTKIQDQLLPFLLLIISGVLLFLLITTESIPQEVAIEQESTESVALEDQNSALIDSFIEERESLAESRSQIQEKQKNEMEKEVNEIAKQMKNDAFNGDIEETRTLVLDYLHTQNESIEEVGYLYLPQHPARLPQIKNQGVQLDVPLYLQKDPKWRQLNYGNDDTRQLGENGCAIVSLAMIDTYLSKRTIAPRDILNWSKDDYYVKKQGTSWEIFADFAEERDYDFYNYGNNFHEAMDGLLDGQVIIASMTEGIFTDEGHFIVIRGYNPSTGLVYINDSNDDPEKMHSLEGFSQQKVIDDGVNYWGFSR